MKIPEFINRCNQYTIAESPFLFIIDFEMEDIQLFRLEEAAGKGVYYEVNGSGNSKNPDQSFTNIFRFDIDPFPYTDYLKAYLKVQAHILHGNSFLLNLTFPTKLTTDLSLFEIFSASSAPYKLLYKEQFVVFSPESFIKIKNGIISSFPMKGTIDATLPDARKRLLENEKEIQEHNTIVDLIRNDLSMVSRNVKVIKFRYIDHVKAFNKELLQVSSEIQGEHSDKWQNNLGEIILKLLPAGSICGAPKNKTLEIIRDAEGTNRGFFTGIFGIFDGKEVDSAVMIRYIEKTTDGLQFRSGGGITGQSDPLTEYNEMIQKVYVPII
jgi:para-aminobenzoate synthetase component 1